MSAPEHTSLKDAPHEVIVRFLATARAAGVRVSVAEGLDAIEAAEAVGYSDRVRLRDAIGMMIAKSPEEKAVYEVCFDGFFSRAGLTGGPLARDNARTSLERGDDLGELGQMLLAPQDAIGLELEMEKAANHVGISQIRLFLQVNMYAHRIMEVMGLTALEGEIGTMRRIGTPETIRQADELTAALDDFREDVRDFVHRQLEVYARGEAERIKNDALTHMRLNTIQPQDKARVRSIVRQMARRLATRHARVRRKTRKGQLDVRRVIRMNASTDGVLFRTAFRSKKIDRPKIVALCDVSTSVAASAEFLLLFLWSLREVLAGVRAFAFSSDLIEVSDILDHHDSEDAARAILKQIGFGATDYGASLATFRRNWLSIIDRKTTVVILGDARSRGAAPRADIVRELSERSKRLIWLNPEPRLAWGTGDSAMRHYRSYCNLAMTCNSIAALETVVSDLLETERFG